jgi:hypothetical protein
MGKEAEINARSSGERRAAAKGMARWLVRMVQAGLAMGMRKWKEGLESAWREQTSVMLQVLYYTVLYCTILTYCTVLMLQEARELQHRTSYNGALGSIRILAGVCKHWMVKRQGDAFKHLKRLVYYEKRLRKSFSSMYNAGVRTREEGGKRWAVHTWVRWSAADKLAEAVGVHGEAVAAQEEDARAARARVLTIRIANTLVFGRARLFMAAALRRWRAYLHSMSIAKGERTLSMTRASQLITSFVYSRSGAIGAAWAVFVQRVWEARVADAKAAAAAEVAQEYGTGEGGLSGLLAGQAQSAGAGNSRRTYHQIYHQTYHQIFHQTHILTHPHPPSSAFLVQLW